MPGSPLHSRGVYNYSMIIPREARNFQLDGFTEFDAIISLEVSMFVDVTFGNCSENRMP